METIFLTPLLESPEMDDLLPLDEDDLLGLGLSDPDDVDLFPFDYD